MELPIQIIVVLFVAIVVGGAVVMFSQTTLNRAQLDLADRWRDDPALKDSVFDVKNATANTIMTLAQECHKRLSATPDQEVCYALFAEEWSVDFAAIDGATVAEGVVLNTSGVTADPITAVKILYHPSGQIRVVT